jgi:hypothetical protein
MPSEPVSIYTTDRVASRVTEELLLPLPIDVVVRQGDLLCWPRCIVHQGRNEESNDVPDEAARVPDAAVDPSG